MNINVISIENNYSDERIVWPLTLHGYERIFTFHGYDELYVRKGFPRLAVTMIVCPLLEKGRITERKLEKFSAHLDRSVAPVERLYVSDRLEKLPPGVPGRLVRTDRDVSIVQACNQALALVRTPFVIFLRLDDRMFTDGIAELEAAIQAYDDRVFACGDWRLSARLARSPSAQQSFDVSALPLVDPDRLPEEVDCRLGSGDEDSRQTGPSVLVRLAELVALPTEYEDGFLVPDLGPGGPKAGEERPD